MTVDNTTTTRDAKEPAVDQATKLRQLVESRDASSQSVHMGRVSYRPQKQTSEFFEHDQVETFQFARAIAIASGKGGVGKSNIAVNLAIALAGHGQRVCLIDADLGLANVDVLCNITPRYTLDDVVHDRCRLGEALSDAPGGFQLIPGASGVARMADLSPGRQSHLMERLVVLEKVMDILLIDTGAGIDRNVLGFAAAANTVLVVVTPEPPSITDGYGLIKSLVQRHSTSQLEVVVNMAQRESEARSVFRRLDRVSRTFLNHPLSYAGYIPDDPLVRESVHVRTPFTLAAPKSPATRAVARLADRLMEKMSLTSPELNGKAGFFARLSKWISVGRT